MCHLLYFVFSLAYAYVLNREGTESISWSQGFSLNQSISSSRTFLSTEHCIWKSDQVESVETNILFDDEKGNDENIDFSSDRQLEPRIFQPGTYKYDISSKLPEDLIPSFSDQLDNSWVASNDSIVPTYMGKERSSILYRLLVSLDMGDEGIVQTQYPFSTIAKIEPQFRNPMTKVITDQKSFLFGNNSPLTATITLSNGNIIWRGQKCPINLDICNLSSRTVENVRFIVDVITTLATDDNKESIVKRETVLSTLFSNLSVSPNKKIHTDLTLNIPDSIPLSVNGKLIKKRYEVSCELVVQMATNLVLKYDATVLSWYPEETSISEGKDSSLFSIDTDDEEDLVE